jgi:hypothetical protein
LLVGSCAAAAPASAAEDRDQAGGVAATAPSIDPTVDKILTRLERREVRDLRAKVVWRQKYVIDLEEDAVSKIGELWYLEGEPVAQFLIHFASKITGGRKDKIDERYLFDGEWYTELNGRSKSYARRQIRRSNDPGDPYKVGEGVFPMPFGQKKEDILREFEVVRIPTTDVDPPNTDHLRLSPREGTRSGRHYKTLEFWVSREGPTAGLPIRVKVAKKDGTGVVNSFITITFSDVSLNSGLSSGLFQIECPDGYNRIEEPLEPAAAPPSP